MNRIAFAPALPGLATALTQAQSVSSGSALCVLEAGATTAQLMAELTKAVTEFVLVLDPYTQLVGRPAEPKVESKIALIGAPVQTALGRRLGYDFVTSALESEQHRRRPVPLPPEGTAAGVKVVDLPNEGAWMLRMSTLRELDGLKTELEPMLALQEYAIRVREAGYACASDTRLTSLRLPGLAEPTLADEAAFRSLRADAVWHAFLRTLQPRMPHRKVALLALGKGSQSAALLQRAGYPVEHIFWAANAAPPPGVTEFTHVTDAVQTLREQCLNARSRSMVVLDTDLENAPQGWLLSLLEEVEERADVAVATLGSEGVARVVGAVDTKAALFHIERMPVHNIPPAAETLAAFIDALTDNFHGLGIGMRQTADRITRPTPLPERSAVFLAKPVTAPPAEIGIILSSRGVSDVNDLTLGRIRANTRDPYAVTIVVPRAASEIVQRLRADSSLRVLTSNSENNAAEQLSYALAQAQTEYVAVLRDDFVVPEGWLKTLEAALTRIPNAGIVAPRVSNGIGAQGAEGERFSNTGEFHLAAARRRKEYARKASVVASLAEPAMLVRREVIERVGAIDATLGLSEYAMIDYCIRVQAAGYNLVIAEDALLHKVHADMLPKDVAAVTGNPQYARAFARKWQLGRDSVMRLDIGAMIGTELAAAHCFLPFPVPAPQDELVDTVSGEDRAVFLLPVENTAAWQRAARLIKKYQKTFTAADTIVLSIGCMGDLDLETAARRVERIIRELNIDPERCADVLISDGNDRAAWLAQLPEGPRLLLLPDDALAKYPQVKDLSPSGLRQTLSTVGRG